MNFKAIPKNLFLLSIVFGCFFRLIVFFAADNLIDTEEIETYSRINVALRWIESGQIFPDLNFSPLYFYFIKYSLKLVSDPLVAPRILSLIFGILLLIPYFCFIDVFFSRRIALCSSLFLACLPLAVRGSTVSLPMVIYGFFMLSSLYLFFFYLLKAPKNAGFMVVSACFLTIAAGLRFEGLLFIPLLSLILLFYKRVKESLLFFLIAMVLPVIYMTLSFKQTGYLLAAARTSAIYSLAAVKDIAWRGRILLFFDSLSKVMTLFLLLAAISGILISFCIRKKYWLGIMLFIYMGVFGYKAAQGTFIPNLLRYFFLIGILLIPYSIFCLQFFFFEGSFFRGDKTKRALLISFLLFFTVFFIFRTLAEIRQVKINPDTKELIKWARGNLTAKDKIVLDRFEHPYIILESGLTYKQFYTPLFSPEGVVDKKSLEGIIKKVAPGYLICRYILETRGIYKDIILSLKKQYLRLVFSNDRWKVYKIEKTIRNLNIAYSQVRIETD